MYSMMADSTEPAVRKIPLVMVAGVAWKPFRVVANSGPERFGVRFAVIR